MATAIKRADLFIAAEPRELAGLLSYCRGVRRLDWPLAFARAGELNGHPVVLVANGPGKLAAEAVEVAVRQAEGTSYGIAAVVSIGYCGALDPELETGDVIAASSYAAPQAKRPFRTVEVFTSDRVIGTVEEKRTLRATGAAAVEMEAVAVAHSAALLNLPYYCVRAVMDRAEDGFSLDFNALRDRAGRFSRWRIVLAALVHPVRAIPDLIRLERQGRIAARALGEFIADCGF